MTESKWTSNASFMDIAQRLHVLSLRLARIHLAQLAQRNLATMHALTERK